MGLFDWFKREKEVKQEANLYQRDFYPTGNVSKSYSGSNLEPYENGDLVIRDSKETKIVYGVEKIDFRYSVEKGSYDIKIHNYEGIHEVRNANVEQFEKKDIKNSVFGKLKEAVRMNKIHSIDSLKKRMEMDMRRDRQLIRNQKYENVNIEKSQNGYLLINHKDMGKVEGLKVDRMQIAYNSNKDQYHLAIKSNDRVVQLRNIQPSDLSKIDDTIPDKKEVLENYQFNEYKKQIVAVEEARRTINQHSAKESGISKFENVEIASSENGNLKIRSKETGAIGEVKVDHMQLAYNQSKNQYHLQINSNNQVIQLRNIQPSDLSKIDDSIANKKEVMENYQFNEYKKQIVATEEAKKTLNQQTARNQPQKLENVSVMSSENGNLRIKNKTTGTIEELKVDEMGLAYNQSKDQYHLNINSNGQDIQLRNIKRTDLEKIDNSVKGKEKILQSYHSNEHKKKLEAVQKTKSVEKQPTLNESVGMSI